MPSEIFQCEMLGNRLSSYFIKLDRREKREGEKDKGEVGRAIQDVKIHLSSELDIVS